MQVLKSIHPYMYTYILHMGKKLPSPHPVPIPIPIPGKELYPYTKHDDNTANIIGSTVRPG